MPLSPLRGLLYNVGLGFAVTLLLMLTVIGLGVAEMAQLNSELSTVVNVNNLKTRLASRMRDTLRDRAVLMHTIVVATDPWEKNDLFLQFLQYGERYAKDRNQLATLLKTPRENRLLSELDLNTASNQPAVFNVVESALANNNYGALRQLQQEVIPLQNQLLQALDNMTRLQREANENALAKTYAAYQETRNMMLALGALATLVATLVAVLVSRRLLSQTRQLSSERQKYQTLFETNSDAVIILDDHGFIDCNPATLALFGMPSVQDFLRTPMQHLGVSTQANGLVAIDHARQSIARARKLGHAQMDWVGRRQDGSTFSAEIALHAMQLEGRPVIQAIMRDVSERRAIDAAREAAREAALKVAQAKSEFVANVSHEIRTPMHGILGMSHLLLKTPLNAQQRDYISTLKISAESLLTIMNDILDFSKIEAGKLNIEHVPFSPLDLLNSIISLYQARAKDKNLRLTLSLPEPPPAALLGDPTRIRQVLLNLVDNALKFTPQGEVELRATFTHTSDGVRCQFSVRDSGIGISPDAQTRIFQAFSQADASTTRRYGGTGLGLTVSNQLVGLMGGQLSVQSLQNAGSTFTLNLLLLATSLPLAELPASPVLQLQGRILVAEDHPVNQKVLAHQLREMGLHYEIVADGKQALALLEKQTFDMVLMDWQMPEMDGLEATRQIRQSPLAFSHIPIVALTANASPGFREVCLATGANDYLAKPYTDTELATLLTHWLLRVEPGDADDSAAGSIEATQAAATSGEPEPIQADASILDMAALQQRYPDNPALVNDLAALFNSTTASSFATLKHSIAQADVPTCLRETHALRGAAASVMAKAIQEGAARIEQHIKRGDFTAAAAALSVLEARFQDSL